MPIAPASIARLTRARMESICAGVAALADDTEHGAAHRSLSDVDRGVRPDAALRPPVELFADVDRTAAVVVRDDGGDALHEIGEVRAIRDATRALGAREVARGVRVGIDESRRDDQPLRLDRSRAGHATRRGVADERDAIAA